MSKAEIYLKLNDFMHFRSLKLKSTKKVSKIKHQKSILVLQIGILIFFGGYFTGLPASSGENEELLNSIGLFNSEHTVENLRGDSISLSKYWKISQGMALSVNILNPVSISDDTISVIRESILSTEKIDIEDSLLHKGPQNSFSNYYVGWAGALENTPETTIPIPKIFEVLNSQKSNGDIVVILSNIKDRSGNTGYTKTILEGEEIVKAFITIYDVDSLSNTQLGTIMRHEFGHALGLGHSTAPEDLMAPTIDMTYPYISECNIAAVTDLYNEDLDGTTICKK
ncbi:MAG: matrixin family metalloprotease [Candidatus Nitrosopumilus sp. bin_68KS]